MKDRETISPALRLRQWRRRKAHSLTLSGATTKGVTQERAANFFRVTVRTYTRWERGTIAVPGPALRLLDALKLLDLTADQGNAEILAIQNDGGLCYVATA